jgi:hypothetical protein
MAFPVAAKARAARAFSFGLRRCAILALGLMLDACGAGKAEQAAYAVCLQAAKKDARYAKAAFASREQSNIQASTGDSGIRVNIPYELDGNKGLYQCIADKQSDGTYKVTF